jgi:PKD repeat protein
MSRKFQVVTASSLSIVLSLVLSTFMAKPVLAWECEEPILKSSNGLTVEIEFKTSSSPDEKVEIDWGDGSDLQVLESNTPSQIVPHTFPAPGEYIVFVKVYNPQGTDFRKCTVKVTVKLPRPTVSLNCENGITLTQERPDDGKNAYAAVVIKPPSVDGMLLELDWVSSQNGVVTWNLPASAFYSVVGEYQVTLAEVDERSVKDLPVKKNLDCPPPLPEKCEEVVEGTPREWSKWTIKDGTKQERHREIPLFDKHRPGESCGSRTEKEVRDLPPTTIVFDCKEMVVTMADAPEGFATNNLDGAMVLTPGPLIFSELVFSGYSPLTTTVQWTGPAAHYLSANGLYTVTEYTIGNGLINVVDVDLARDLQCTKLEVTKTPENQTVQDVFTETVGAYNTGEVTFTISLVTVTAETPGITFSGLTLEGVHGSPPSPPQIAVAATDVITLAVVPPIVLAPGNSAFFQVTGTITEVGMQINKGCIYGHNQYGYPVEDCASATLNVTPTNLQIDPQPGAIDKRLFLPAVQTTRSDID